MSGTVRTQLRDLAAVELEGDDGGVEAGDAVAQLAEVEAGVDGEELALAPRVPLRDVDALVVPPGASLLA